DRLSLLDEGNRIVAFTRAKGLRSIMHEISRELGFSRGWLRSRGSERNRGEREQKRSTRRPTKRTVPEHHRAPKHRDLSRHRQASSSRYPCAAGFAVDLLFPRAANMTAKGLLQGRALQSRLTAPPSPRS